MRLRDDDAIDRVRVRSVLTCDAELGVCALCYGRSLATGKSIELGEAVGVIAAQSIGEPGTQLTMRTFHTGGVAGKDIAGGLPRVVELFEARTPEGCSPPRQGDRRAAPRRGRGQGHPGHGRRRCTVRSTRRCCRSVPVRSSTDGQDIKAGDLITDGPSDPKELMEIKGIRETQVYLVEEVQKVYRDQGVSIHDKHIELIVRQMTRRIGVQEPGDTEFLPGERVDSKVFRDTNRRMVEEGKRPAEGRPEIMGITKASLATDSWLSAASFQETTRVLTEAAIDGKSDSLIGLKENIIIGKLIPAGYRHDEVPGVRYRRSRVRADDVLLERRGGRGSRQRSWRISTGRTRGSRPRADARSNIEVRHGPELRLRAGSRRPGRRGVPRRPDRHVGTMFQLVLATIGAGADTSECVLGFEVARSTVAVPAHPRLDRVAIAAVEVAVTGLAGRGCMPRRSRSGG